MNHVHNKLTPGRADPTRTAALRRKFMAELRKRYARIRFKITQLLVDEDAFGIGPPAPNPLRDRMALNAGRWQFLSNPNKIKEFKKWLRQLLQSELVGKSDEELWQRFVEEGLRKGAGRAFDDTKRPAKLIEAGKQTLDFYKGTRDEFLRSAFNQPVAVEKIHLLAGRAFDELEDITSTMANRITRVLTQGMVQGDGPREVARAMAREVGISRARAETIALTEISRAHADGQLMALESLGVEEVGVAVEWSTSGLGVTAKGYPSPCEICAPMQGVVLKLSEAKGLIPRHPRCLCSWIPANTGEDDAGQKATKKRIQSAIKKSDIGDGWPGAERSIAARRPESQVGNADPLVEFSKAMEAAGE